VSVQSIFFNWSFTFNLPLKDALKWKALTFLDTVKMQYSYHSLETCFNNSSQDEVVRVPLVLLVELVRLSSSVSPLDDVTGWRRVDEGWKCWLLAWKNPF